MPRELPIIFCAEMLKAILEGHKTQTRRLIPGILPTYSLAKKPESYGPTEYAFVDMADPVGSYPIYAKARYQIGDELWVKESWSVFDANDVETAIAYKADPDDAMVWWFSNKVHLIKGKYRLCQWRSARYMPKAYARLWLRVTAVKKPQRIQNISINDIRAEGVCDTRTPQNEIVETYHEKFAQLWNRLHPKTGERWEDSPWVFPYVFEKIER